MSQLENVFSGSSLLQTGTARRSDSIDDPPQSASSLDPTTAETPAKKKRKVNHACVYCRRSHMTCDSDRPCKRCIKRNIGHLCHDEARESPHRKSRGSESDGLSRSDLDNNGNPLLPGNGMSQTSGSPHMLRPNTSHSSISGPTSMSMGSGLNGSVAARYGMGEQGLGLQPRLRDTHSYHPNYMFNANEITDEYNLLNDFLSTSLFDESGMFSTEDMTAYHDPSFMNSMNVSLTGNGGELVQAGHTNSSTQINPLSAMIGSAISRPGSVKPISDKAKEKYYMMAADPSGTDSPEERMNKLLKAKYDAGMLKPFNYVHGYAKLNKYIEKNMKPSSRHKILMQLDRFRPKFRERMQTLTDIELVLVEMWFERSLMEYDRIFASMAIPGCCWRRTGEIFRGNKEMAELISVPIESLRDGKLAIHDFIVEDQLVSYWEKFCAICFDQQQKAMLTSCTLKCPMKGSDAPVIHCCFSFTIKRDSHNIPSLIVGNFLPVDPPPR